MPTASRCRVDAGLADGASGRGGLMGRRLGARAARGAGGAAKEGAGAASTADGGSKAGAGAAAEGMAVPEGAEELFMFKPIATA